MDIETKNKVIEGLKSTLAIKQTEIENLKKFISQCRCEECGNELGEKWSLINENLCPDCFEQYQDDLC